MEVSTVSRCRWQPGCTCYVYGNLLPTGSYLQLVCTGELALLSALSHYRVGKLKSASTASLSHHIVIHGFTKWAFFKNYKGHKIMFC